MSRMNCQRFRAHSSSANASTMAASSESAEPSNAMPLPIIGCGRLPMRRISSKWCCAQSVIASVTTRILALLRHSSCMDFIENRRFNPVAGFRREKSGLSGSALKTPCPCRTPMSSAVIHTTNASGATVVSACVPSASMYASADAEFNSPRPANDNPRRSSMAVPCTSCAPRP